MVSIALDEMGPPSESIPGEDPIGDPLRNSSSVDVCWACDNILTFVRYKMRRNNGQGNRVDGCSWRMSKERVWDTRVPRD